MDKDTIGDVLLQIYFFYYFNISGLIIGHRKSQILWDFQGQICGKFF